MEVVAAGITIRMIVLFALAVAGQIGGSLLLGRTDGWTNPLWSAICVAVYAPSFWAIATLIREGGPLSLIMPLLAAVVPLAVALIAVLLLGEAASWARLGLLVFACAVIGVAGAV